jgi:hypothetical protein
VREKEMFPQWHLPWISMRAISVVAAPNEFLASLGQRDYAPVAQAFDFLL